MADYPDIYADGFSITAGPAGVTLTMTVSDPGTEPGQHDVPAHPVARLRMSPALAEDLAKILSQTLAQAKTGLAQHGSQTIKH